MKQLSGFVKGTSSFLDKVAAICIFSVMILVLSNVFLRAVFKQPILGTYEMVGYLTALGIGFALAHCAVQDGHIAVGFIVDRLPGKIQSAVNILINTVSLAFWIGAVCYLCDFAKAMKIKGLVSLSAEIPVYPFIYLIAVGILGLSLVIMFKLFSSFREVFGAGSLSKQAWELKTSDLVKVEL